MIELYTWSTPNGRKVSIMLEECGLAYEVHPVDISKDEQFAPDFLKISPNNKIPAIVDRETGLSVFESGAILIYLAEKTGRFLPSEPGRRIATLEWLMWQMGGIGPMLGQAHHFLRFNPGKAPYAEERYHKEAQRLYGVADRRLAERPWLAGEELTIADLATWPWLSRFAWQGIELDSFPNVRRWYLELARRPGVQAGYDVPTPGSRHPAAVVIARGGSVARVERALAAGGLSGRIVELTATARTAEDAARACGVPEGAIVKSLVFEIEGTAVLALVAGDRRCDPSALAAALGRRGPVRRAEAELVRAQTGFAIGGVAPVGHTWPLPVAIDTSLRRFARLFAAAGHPHCVFETSFDELCRLTGGVVSDTLGTTALQRPAR